MKYLLMIYTTEDMDPATGTPEQLAVVGEYMEFTQAIDAEGINLGGEALHPVASATTVRVRDGETMVTDGPFAETKEQLGGFYMVECRDLDHAIAVAARIPDARRGSIEVRPVFTFPDDLPEELRG